MEKIKVNMSPNPLDVQTIHASQNDTEARQWEFELHNNGELIDTSDVKEQLVFKAYKGGTEQLLPENGSTPTTSPFNGDIRYPQGLLSDQEFTYRQSPTESDGLAKITDIKGNTLVWNQIAQLNQGVVNTCTKSYDDTTAITTITPTSYESNNVGLWNLVTTSNLKNGHKYYVSIEVKPDNDLSLTFGFGQNIITSSLTSGKFQTVRAILTWTASSLTIYARLLASRWTSGTFQIKNVQCIDLTQMGLDSITDPSEFTSLFNLPYYSYNQGSLLSFNGNGIKTVGKNLASGISQGAVDTHGGTTPNDKRLRVDGFVRVFQGEHYTFTATSNSGKTLRIYTRYFADADGSEQVSYLDWLNLPRSIIIPSGVNYAAFTIRFGDNTDITPSDISDAQIEHGTSATEYEPYTSSTLSLPISTYFPSGMKSAGTVYDELTPTKSITRIGAVDLGSLGWYYNTSSSRFITTVQLADAKRVSNNNEVPNMVCQLFEAVSLNVSADTSRDKTIAIGSSDGNLRVRDSSFTNATAFTQAMSGVYLYYELATPTETSFTTASLVTENAEIPLSNNDGVLIGKCTEQLSENPGFIDAKIKLSDSDGECYSNKIQLHVERSPQ